MKRGEEMETSYVKFIKFGRFDFFSPPERRRKGKEEEKKKKK